LAASSPTATSAAVTAPSAHAPSPPRTRRCQPPPGARCPG
jgi:hypothetical protein